MGARRGEHVPALDGLRGIAILLVMAYHYLGTTGFGGDVFLTRRIASLAIFMWMGVDLFFVLSGFLITGILLRTKEAPRYFSTFYVRRALRIFPLYYGALFAIFVVIPWCTTIDTPELRRIFDAQVWLWAYAQDLCISWYNEDFFNVSWLWVGHFWSLGVEERFYLFWPATVFLLGRSQLRKVAIGLILFAPLYRFTLLFQGFEEAAYVSLLARLDEFVMGALIAILAQERSYAELERVARWALLASGLYLGSVLAITRKPLWWGDWTTLGLGFSALGAGFAGILVLALAPRGHGLLAGVPARFDAVGRFLEMRPLQFAGKYSYGAYVLHTPLQPLYLRLFPPETIASATAGLGHTASTVVGMVGFALLSFGSTLGLAVVLYFAYERPFLRLKRYFEYDAHGTRKPVASAGIAAEMTDAP